LGASANSHKRPIGGGTLAAKLMEEMQILKKSAFLTNWKGLSRLEAAPLVCFAIVS
jgi:hypothetical protein